MSEVFIVVNNERSEHGSILGVFDNSDNAWKYCERARNSLIYDDIEVLTMKMNSCIEFEDKLEADVEKRIDLFVRKIGMNQILVINVKENETIEKLKQRIFHMDEIPIEEQRLIFAGIELEKGCLSDYGVVDKVDLMWKRSREN